MVNTFIADRDIAVSASILDSVRLNKQLFEARQILETLTGRIKGWPYHPATKMWAGYEKALVDYASYHALELESRDIEWVKHWEVITSIYNGLSGTSDWPWWWSDEELGFVIITHRGRLYEKDPVFYSGFFKASFEYRDFVCCKRCNYYWPTHIRSKNA